MNCSLVDIYFFISYIEYMVDSFTLDIGDTYIKAVDASIASGKCNLLQVAFTENNSLFFSNETEQIMEEEASRIKKLIESNKIQKKNVSLVIPDAYTYSQILEMPRLNERELISAIRYQADQFIPMPIDETSIDIEILSDNEITKKILVLMVAAPKKIINRVQSSVELAGLVPVSLENSLSATSRFFLTFGKVINPKSTTLLLVNMELNSTSLYTFETTKGVLLHNHTFPIGYQLFYKELQINTNLDAKKITGIMETYTSNQPSSVPVEQIIAPVLKEYANEFTKFIKLIAERNKTNIGGITFINDSFRFYALPQLIGKIIGIDSQHINISPLLMNNPITNRFQKSLPMFISAIGSNIR
jgi:type IV pilus assembly protein PilM